jgi:hypothetical protein
MVQTGIAFIVEALTKQLAGANLLQLRLKVIGGKAKLTKR